MRSLFFKIFIGLFIIGLTSCEIEDLPVDNSFDQNSLEDYQETQPIASGNEEGGVDDGKD